MSLRHIRLFLALFCLPAFLPAHAVQPEPDSRPLFVPGQVVVKYSADAPQAAIGKLLEGKVQARKRLMSRTPVEVLKLAPQRGVREMIRELEASPLVEYAEPNYYRYPLTLNCTDSATQNCPDDPEADFSNYALHNSGDTDMDMPEAWSIITGAPDVEIAVIDDGFDLDHEDLENNFKGQNGVTCDSGGCTGNGDASSRNSDESHGTAVTGTMAAVGDNATGIPGVVWDADVYPIRIEFTSAGIANAVAHAASRGARIINMSLGGPVFSQLEFDALEQAEQAGVLVVVAAGNEDANTDKAVASYPANYPLPNIVSVAASNSSDRIASFSVWGPRSVDLAAAGRSVRTTQLNNAYSPTISGTSFASPYTAGVAALIAQHLCDERSGSGQYNCANLDTTVDYNDIKAFLLAGAETANDGDADTPLRGRTRAGRVNAKHSLDLVDMDPNNAPATPLLSSLAIVSDTLDNDSLADPGESFDLEITLEVLGDTAALTSFAGTLAVEAGDLAAYAPAADVSIAPAQATQSFTATGSGTEYRAAFPVTLADFSDNRQYLFRLDLDMDADGTVDQKRYFYFEVGALDDAQRVTQTFQRTDWDEFHAFHFNLPAGAPSLVIETTTNGGTDIDLLARETLPPEYLITLGVDPEGGEQIFWAGAEDQDENTANDAAPPAEVSGRFDGEEVIVIDNPTAAIYHLVTLNYALSQHNYTLKATADATRHRLLSADLNSTNFQDVGLVTVNEGETLSLRVERVGPTDRATNIRWRTVGAADNVSYVESSFNRTGLSAATAGDDYPSAGGTLSWEAGETAAKTLSLSIPRDSAEDDNEIFRVELYNPGGNSKATRGLPFDSFVLIRNAAPPPSSGGGGGGGHAAWLLPLLGLPWLLRRRVQDAENRK